MQAAGTRLARTISFQSLTLSARPRFFIFLETLPRIRCIAYRPGKWPQETINLESHGEIQPWPATSTHRLGNRAALTVNAMCAPDQRVNTVTYFFDAGLLAYGVLPSRPRDFAGGQQD
jgi:hypothetical protein